MILVCCPVGRGNWRHIHLVLKEPQDLFPALRAEPIVVGTRITIGALRLRVKEVHP